MPSNSFQTTDWVVMESIRLLTNKLEVSQFFDTRYTAEFTKTAFTPGESIRVKLPQQFVVRNGLAYNPQAIDRRATTVTVQEPFGVDFEFDSIEDALETERGREAFSREYLAPAMATMKQEIDSRAALFAYQNTPNIVGALGTDPTTTILAQQARQKMLELAGWNGSAERGMIIPPHVLTAIQPSTVQYFNPSSEISKLYKEGSIGRAGGFDWYESMSLYRSTAATWAGTVEVTSAVTTSGVSQLMLTCTNGDTFKQGDVFSIAGVNATNPMTRRSTGAARTFTITSADQTIIGTSATISIYPTIYGPGSTYQNVDALPATGADLTLFPGTTLPNGKTGTNGLACTKEAFAMVGIPLEVPTKAEMASQKTDPDSGLKIRFIRDFDPVQSKMINRFDALIGFGVLHADAAAVRVLSA